jgi:hypothetical protein
MGAGLNILYLAASLVGVAILVGLNVALFGRAQGAVDRGSLERRLALDWPGFRAGAYAQSRDGMRALMENASDGSVHLAIMRGDSLITRKLAAQATQLARNESTLSLRLGEFTLPLVTLEFSDAAIASDWERRLAHGAA